MPTPQDIHTTAQQLATLYQELDRAKYEHTPTRLERKMAPTFNSVPPAPIWTLSDDAHFTTYLTEYVQDAARYTTTKPTSITNGQTMCAWIQTEANTIATLDVAPLLMTEMTNQIKELNTRLARTRPPQPISIAEHRQTARSITHRLAQMGHKLEPATLRQWAKRGKVTVVTNTQGHNTYLLTEILDQL